MIDWISMNISTILVAMAVIACIMLVIVKMVREKKSGNTSCSGCGNTSCPKNRQ